MKISEEEATMKDWPKTSAAFYEFRNQIKKKYPILCIRSVISTDDTLKQIKEFSDKWIKTADQVTFNSLQHFDQISDAAEYAQCHDIFFHAHINYTGEIRKCGYQYFFGENDVLGSLHEQRLSNVWNSYKLRRLRWLHYKKQFPQVCKKCHGFTNKGLEYNNARKYNVSKNKVVSFFNKLVNIT
jgi:radical SAM protein with 4Fe4S-binding SPASM domain